MHYQCLDAYRRDCALALRSIRRNPGFAFVAIVVLGLGIGMATAVFSVLDAVLIRDLPVREQDRVVVLWGEGTGSLPNRPLRYREFERFREQSRELGVRLALGAAPAQLCRLMLREALLTAAAGVGIGVAGAIAGSRFLRALLFEISPFDPLVLIGACAVLLAAAAAAAYGPARRATTVEPAIALRSE